MRKYGFISHFNHVFLHKIIKNELMTSYLHLCRLLSKNSKVQSFQYEISGRMRYLWAIYDDIENFRIIQFQSEFFSIKTGFLRVFAQFSMWKPFWYHKMYESRNEGLPMMQCIERSFLTPPPLLKILRFQLFLSWWK